MCQKRSCCNDLLPLLALILIHGQLDSFGFGVLFMVGSSRLDLYLMWGTTTERDIETEKTTCIYRNEIKENDDDHLIMSSLLVEQQFITHLSNLRCCKSVS